MLDKNIDFKFLLARILVLILVCFSIFYSQCGGSTTSEEAESPLTASIDTPEEDTTIAVGESVSFTGSRTSTDEDATITYLWSFNDAADDSSDAEAGEISFDSEGEYLVTLTVSDEDGNSEETSVTITVETTTSTSTTLTASIDLPAEAQTIYVGESVSFSGSGTSTDEDATLTYSWDYDDGATASTEQHPGETTFSSAGTYTVTLTVTDDDDDTATDTVSVTVVGASQVAGGYEYTCALMTDSTVKCWGDNTYGQLGNGTNTSSTIPVDVYGIDSATHIDAGYRHACAVLEDGSAQCWGKASYYLR